MTNELKDDIMKPTTFTLDEVLQILKNLGHDVECGECMSIAFTNLGGHAHTCDANAVLIADVAPRLAAVGVYSHKEMLEALVEGRVDLCCEHIDHRRDAYEAASRYFDYLDVADANGELLDEMRVEMDRLLLPYNSNPAMIAFLNRKRLVIEARIQERRSDADARSTA